MGTIYNLSGIYLQMTTPVGTYAANPWGLYDMIGNVWEWCSDWFGNYPTGSVADPQGPVTGSYRAIRGGYCNNSAQHCRSAARIGKDPAIAYRDVGFRVVLAPSQP